MQTAGLHHAFERDWPRSAPIRWEPEETVDPQQALRAAIFRLIDEALAARDAETFFERTRDAVSEFDHFVQSLHALHPVNPDWDLDLLDAIEAYGGQRRRDQLEHALNILDHVREAGAELFACKLAPSDPAADHRYARQFEAYRRLTHWMLVCAARTASRRGVEAGVVDAVFASLLDCAARCDAAVQMGLRLRFPDEESEG